MAIKKKNSGDATKPTVRRIAGRGASARAASALKKKGAKAKAATKAASRRRVSEPEHNGNGAGGGGGTLVIVESPRKAKTLSKYLGRGYRVKATVGHVRDLPEKKLGMDVDNGF